MPFRGVGVAEALVVAETVVDIVVAATVVDTVVVDWPETPMAETTARKATAHEEKEDMARN